MDTISENWNYLRIKDITSKIGNGITPKGGSNVYIEKGIPFLRSQNVHNNGLKLDNVSFITKKLSDDMPFSKLNPLDILINITGASIGRTCLVPQGFKEGNISQHIAFLRFLKNINKFFLSYYLKSDFIYKYIMTEQVGASKEALNLGQIARIPILLPNIKTQTKIATYLDQKTVTIDKEIELLEKKIKRYKELKQTLINETVLRGLDKNVKLKESRIEWIGKIPEHWEVKRMKDIYKITKEKVGSKSKDFQLLSLTQNGVISRDIDGGFGKFPAEFDTYQIVKKNDLIFCLFDMDVTPRTVGISKNYGMITGAYTIITRKKDVNNKYIYYLFLSADIYKKLSLYYTGLRNTIKKERFLSLNISFPPLIEQIEIISYIDDKTKKIDTITKTIKDKIDLLKEFRKTLINDAVTGKIKVTS